MLPPLLLPVRKKRSFWMLATTTFCLSLPSLLSRQNDEVTRLSFLFLSAAGQKESRKYMGENPFHGYSSAHMGTPKLHPLLRCSRGANLLYKRTGP